MARRADAALVGLPVVYLRPTAFFDGMFLVQGVKGIREDNVIRLPFADGKTALIAGADVGAAAAAVLAEPAPHIGKFYDLTGLQSLTMAQYAQEFSGVLGRTIRYVNVPPQTWEAKLREARLPEHLTAHLSTMGQLHRDNRYDRMTDSFQSATNRRRERQARVLLVPWRGVSGSRRFPSDSY